MGCHVIQFLSTLLASPGELEGDERMTWYHPAHRFGRFPDEKCQNCLQCQKLTRSNIMARFMSPSIEAGTRLHLRNQIPNGHFNKTVNQNNLLLSSGSCKRSFCLCLMNNRTSILLLSASLNYIDAAQSCEQNPRGKGMHLYRVGNCIRVLRIAVLQRHEAISKTPG